MPINKKNYPKYWKQISEAIRFGRAENQCEECKALNYAPHPVTKSKVILTVHHIDGNTRNNLPSNLIALCQKCHLQKHRK